MTHNNIFWVAALLLAAIKLPDFATPLNAIARSVDQQTQSGARQPDYTAPLNTIARAIDQQAETPAKPPDQTDPISTADRAPDQETQKQGGNDV